MSAQPERAADEHGMTLAEWERACLNEMAARSRSKRLKGSAGARSRDVRRPRLRVQIMVLAAAIQKAASSRPVMKVPRHDLDIIASGDINACMASLTIRDLEPETKERLRVRAARHGRSMEEEVRVILRSAIAEGPSSPVRLGSAIHGRFEALGGAELELPPREPASGPPRV